MYHRRCLWVLTLVCCSLLAAVPVLAQLETYASPHLFALPTSTTTRLMGMGGFITCLKDAGFPNPAFAGTLSGPSAAARVVFTDFDKGLNLRGEQFFAAYPLRPNRSGLQLTGFRLRTREAGSTPTPVGPGLVSLEEDDVALHYGRRMSPDVCLGLGLSPVFRSTTDYTSAVGGASIAHTESKGKSGYRLGGLYEFTPQSYFGFVYDLYHEDVTGTGLAFGPGVKGKFSSHQLALGISGPLCERVMGALEWGQLSTEGAGARLSDNGWRYGIEYSPNRLVAVRLGKNDGAFSGGLGLTHGAWSLQYAYVKDWNDDSVRDTFGASKTNSVEARYVW